jgi:AraC-like DNA-binding protein
LRTVRTAEVLASRPEFTVSAVTCRDHHAGWSPVEPRRGHGLVLVRRGRFRRSTENVVSTVDQTTGYLSLPGTPERFAHPAGGDVCTLLTFSGSLWRKLAGDGAVSTRSPIYVDAAADLIHRRLLLARADAAYALTEELLRLLSLALRQTAAARTPAADRASGSDPALVATAREAIAAGHPASAALIPLAELLGVSPYRLSRAFPRELGVSLTRYRNRVRVGRALDRLEQGETSLATLAADLGFADQPHLTRTLRSHLAHTPTTLRRLLAEQQGTFTAAEREQGTFTPEKR